MDFDYQKTYDYACKILARRMHSVFELRQKMKRRGFSEKQITATLQSLTTEGFLDDKKYAVEFVRLGLEYKGYGPQLLKSKLLQRGIGRELIEAALQIYTPAKQKQIALELAEKKYNSYQKNLDQQKQKIGLYLKNRGFSLETILAVWEDLLSR